MEASVQDDDSAAVTCPADEATEPLLQSDCHGRQQVVLELVAALAAKELKAGFCDGIPHVRERQLLDLDEAQRVAGYVDALPEGSRAEKH